ncbi:pyrroline-5-carboxylate reductase-like isoform X1 [Vespa mandarinia]|uniref:pyrroline-5-carboxylate reductase-like isoform X1 n=3 Tax=Vespa mandarinia TaxID=7446 RepID=UPI00160ED69F|nr:pyrroline-5-carboxylate reductase-like isoform X1 [Vespa mandarinia]
MRSTIILRTMKFVKATRRFQRRLNVRNVSDQHFAGIEEKKKKIDKMFKIGFFGAGKMAQALAKGFIRAGLSKGDMMLASCLPNDVGSIENFKDIGSKTVFNNSAIIDHGEILILAVKPQVVPMILPELKNCSKLLLSIAMGIPISRLEKALPKGTPVIRVMPNTPALVGCGATVFSRGTHAGDKEAEIVKKLFSAVGFCEEVSENMIDPVTALAGSGPAYVFMMIEALADGAVKMGLMRDLAYKLAAQTVLGAGTMVRETNIHPGQLKDDVASPAGSTITAIHQLEKHGLRAALIGAIEAATHRCKEINLILEKAK